MSSRLTLCSLLLAACAPCSSSVQRTETVDAAPVPAAESVAAAPVPLFAPVAASVSEPMASVLPPPALGSSAAAPVEPSRVPGEERPSKPAVKFVRFTAEQGGPQAAVIVSPSWGQEGEMFPVLVALTGLGEVRKGIERGAWGWVKDNNGT